MAKKFLTPIDLQLNELQNAILQHIAGNAPSLTEGLFWWDATAKQFKYYDGSNVEVVGTSSGAGTVTGVSVVSANGFAGTSNGDAATPALTLSTTVTGLLKGNGAAVSAAASGTDYAPATSGSSVLKGNGSGGFSNAASGTDYAPATSGTSILKGNGSGGFSAATAGTDYLAPSGNGSALTGITQSQVSGSAPLASPALTGTPTAPTATALTSSTQLATTAYADTAVSTEKTRALAAEALLAPLASPALTGTPTAPTPTTSTGIANKGYVDATVQGLDPKPTATVAAATALPAGTYANGSSGVGATFTVTATGTTTVDGHVLAAGDLVLLTAQASAFQNGLYTVTTAGTTGVATVLTRHADMDQAAEFPGAFVPVGSTGSSYANSLWLANPSGTVTVGTTSIPFTELNKGTDLAAGAGIAITGNTVSIENSGVLTVSHGGTGAATLTGLVKGNGTSAMTAATAGTDYVVPSGSITGNAATATKLATARTINGVSFDGSANITVPATVKYAATIGDGSSTSIAVTHNLGTRDVIVQVYDAATYVQYECDVTRTSTSVVTLGFTTAPAASSLNVVVIG